MRRILVATDLTEGAHEALGRACAMAREAGAELRIVHAPSPSAEQGECSIARSRLRDELAGFQDASDKSELHFAIGMPRMEPVEAILAEAERFKPDLIVLGAHGEPRFRDVIFGTTASHVAQAAKQPVLIAQTDHRAPYGRLLVAIEDDSAEQILRLALGIVSATDMFVVHAQDSAAPSLFGGELLEDARADQEVMTREVADVVKALGRSTAEPRIHNIVEPGDAVDIIMKTWIEVKPDLLVMGTHGRKGLSRLLRGSKAEAAMLGCTSDILVARTG